MRKFVFAALLTVSSSAYAAGSPLSVAPGEMLRDAHNVRLGLIDQVYPDGTVGLIIESNYVHVPVSTIKIVDGKPVTSMTKADLESH